MDMIGTLNGTRRRASCSKAAGVQARDGRAGRAAETYTDLTIQTSLHSFNSDHVPFIDAGVPAS